MLKIWFFLLLLPLLHSPSDKVIEWVTETEHDFGDLLRHQPATFEFQFKNISDQAIVIDNVRPQCGCTAPDWDSTPIEPDSVGTLRITFDAGKEGFFRKKVKVFFSGQRKGEKIYVTGYV
ncbi:MAG: DUF1573 domain-containing protein, partial [Bacteroidota bacterium]